MDGTRENRTAGWGRQSGGQEFIAARSAVKFRHSAIARTTGNENGHAFRGASREPGSTVSVDRDRHLVPWTHFLRLSTETAGRNRTVPGMADGESGPRTDPGAAAAREEGDPPAKAESSRSR